MLSDELSDAIGRMEMYEEAQPERFAPFTEDIRKLKLDMELMLMRLDMPPDVAEHVQPEDFEWLRTESLKRAAKEAPYQFDEVFDGCVQDLWTKKFGVRGQERRQFFRDLRASAKSDDQEV
jgi:hypothetical protein